MYQQVLNRTICEKCGKVTLVHLISDVRLRLWDDQQGQMVFVTLCPEHRAELLRLISNFFEGVMNA